MGKWVIPMGQQAGSTEGESARSPIFRYIHPGEGVHSMKKMIVALLAALLAVIPLSACNGNVPSEGGAASGSPTTTASNENALTAAEAQKKIAEGMQFYSIAHTGSLPIGDAVVVDGEACYLVNDPDYPTYQDLKNTACEYFSEATAARFLTDDFGLYFEHDGQFMVKGEGSGFREDWQTTKVQSVIVRSDSTEVEATVEVYMGEETPEMQSRIYTFVQEDGEWVISAFHDGWIRLTEENQDQFSG